MKGSSFVKLFSGFTLIIIVFFNDLTKAGNKTDEGVTTAVLYKNTDKTGMRVTWDNTQNWWNDMDSLSVHYCKERTRIKNCSFYPGLICERGAWLVYQEANYEVPSLDTVTFVSAYPKLICHPIDDMPKVGSIQMISRASDSHSATISLFSEPNFGGPATLASVADTHTNLQMGNLGSMILYGKQAWTVGMGDGKDYCFIRDRDVATMAFPICFLSNIVDKTTFKNGRVHYVRPKCRGFKNDTSRTIKLKECVDVGTKLASINPAWPSGVAPPNETETEAYTKRCNLTQEEGYIVDAEFDEEMTKIMEARLNGTLASGKWLKGIKNRKNIWKMELFDTAFMLFITLCPDEVADLEFMQIWAAMYMMHLDKVWESGKFLNTSISDTEWRELMHDMDMCHAKSATASILESVTQVTIDQVNSYNDLKDMREKFEPNLEIKKDLDYVMEINWLMANLVAGVCYAALDHDVNFLPRFLNRYHELFFLPIMEQWNNPGKYEAAYKFIFGGFGMEKSITRLALCTNNLITGAANLAEPYVRPQEQKDQILLPKVVERKKK